MKVFFDLDRTLLDTEQFTIRLWRHLAQDHPLDPISEVSRIKSQFTLDGDYQIWDHIKDVGIGKAEVLGSKTVLSAYTLLFADAEGALNYANSRHDVEILTAGFVDYQGFKLACLPLLDRYKSHIVQAHKREFLASVEGASVLVDDKDLAGQLPENVIFIHLDRNSKHNLVRLSDVILLFLA